MRSERKPKRTGSKVAQVAGLGYALQANGRGEAKKGLSMFTMFPLLTFSLLIYAGCSAAFGAGWTDQALPAVTMLSGEEWIMTNGDLFLVVSLFFLFIEILRATNTGTDSILNHVFSVLLFLACVMAFLFVPRFGTSTFFLYMLMTFLDFMAGFIVTTFAARRDFGVGSGIAE